MQQSLFLSLMQERGWPLLDVEATEHLTVTSKLGDTPVRFEGFGPGLWALGSPDEGAWLCFTTITVGEPQGEPTRWAVLTQDDVMAQVVGGDDWAVVGAGFLISTQIGLQEAQHVSALLALVEHLIPPKKGAKLTSSVHNEWPFETLDVPAVSRRAWPLKLGGSTMVLSSFAGFIGAIAAFGEIGVLFMYPALGLGLGGALAYLMGSARRKAIFRAHGHAKVTNQTLASSPVFNDFKEIRACRPEWFSVVKQGEDDWFLGEASVQSAIVVAAMTEYNLTLRLKLHATLWPDEVISNCVFLPRSWCTAEITGPSEQLIRVPDRKGEQRSQDNIRWQMGPDELDQGALVDWLRQTEAVFHGAQSGPYR